MCSCMNMPPWTRHCFSLRSELVWIPTVATFRQSHYIATFRQVLQQSVSMGSGKAFRRRQKNAEKANVSLLKASYGKGTVHAPLGSAPTKDDYKDKMPASLRRMLLLKEVAEQPAKRRKLDSAQQQAHSQNMRQDGKHTSNGVQQQQQQQQQHLQDANPPETGVQQKQQQHGQSKPNTHQQQQGPQAGAGQQPKKLKQKKKEYLNAKKLKKKGQCGKAAADQDMELETERVAFGHVVHAPPEVALKSKHWATNSKAQQQQQQQYGRQKPTSGGSGKKHTSKERPPKQQPAEDADLMEARQQLIDSYRAARPGPQEGQATLKTLKELVRKQSGA